MDWTGIIGLCTTGGVLYLIVEKLFDRKRSKEEVKHQQTENIRETVDYGIPMIQIYDEIRKIVIKETEPIQTKLDKALERIDMLEENWCCYRNDCDFRIRNKKDAEISKKIDSVAHETFKHVCKD